MPDSPTVVLIEIREHFTPEMDLLRREFSDHDWPQGTSADEFDPHSVHLTASVNGELAGMVRLTKRPHSVLSAWAVGPHHIPSGESIIEATRAVVARKWRGMDLYKVLMVEATRYCCRAGAEVVVGGVEPTFPLLDFLASIGYENQGEPTQFHNPPKGIVFGQVLVQCPARAIPATDSHWHICQEKLARRA